jgi:hypothetical protein
MKATLSIASAECGRSFLVPPKTNPKNTRIEVMKYEL